MNYAKTPACFHILEPYENNFKKNLSNDLLYPGSIAVKLPWPKARHEKKVASSIEHLPLSGHITHKRDKKSIEVKETV